MSVLRTITVNDYITVPSLRAEADQVMAAGGLDKSDVFEIIDLGDRYRVGLFTFDPLPDGQRKIRVENDEPVRRWVEVAAP